MNFEEQFKKLTELARAERTPQVSVAHAVLGALSHKAARYEAASERQLMWVAVVSSAAAAMVVVAAIAAYYSYADPITEISRAIFWVTQ
jgi:dethiobiotin synthetase